LENDFPLTVPSTITKEKAKEKLFSKIDDLPEESKTPVFHKRKKVHFLYSGIAAGITILIVLFAGMFNTTTVVNLSHNQHVNLPDQSKVMMKKGSELKYIAKTYTKKRVLELSGEAFFDVTKGESFIVKGELGSVKVLGTSFNVRSNEKEFIVKCYSGKVLVKTNFNKEEILNPGKQIRINSYDGHSVSGFDSEFLPRWQYNEIMFKEQTLKEIFQELEIIFDTEFFLDIDLNRKYSGLIPTQNIDQALQMICIPMGIKFDKVDYKTVRIY